MGLDFGSFRPYFGDLGLNFGYFGDPGLGFGPFQTYFGDQGLTFRNFEPILAYTLSNFCLYYKAK